MAMKTLIFAPLPVLLALSLAACQGRNDKANNLAALDAQLAGNITVDADLVNGTEGKGGQHGTLGALARRQARGAAKGACIGKIEYGAGWADRLPHPFTLYPKARLIEAAGSSARDCPLRAASFETDAPVGQVVDYYAAQARQGGYDAERQSRNGAQVLGGTRGEAAYYFTFAGRKGGGTMVDLIASGG